jgi:hypothetical protein
LFGTRVRVGKLSIGWWLDHVKLRDEEFEHEILVRPRRLGMDVEQVMRLSGRDRKLFDPKMPP